jgi:hypothetical protein
MTVVAVAAHSGDWGLFASCTAAAVSVWNAANSEVALAIDFVSPPTAAAFTLNGQARAIGCEKGFCFWCSLPLTYLTQFIAGSRKSRKKKPNNRVTAIVFRNAHHFLVSTNDSRIRM